MNRQTALKALRLSPDASKPDIIGAFNRLARRYPLHQFPERHTQLLEAKTTLLNPALGFKDILFEHQLDLSWLEPHTRQTATTSAEHTSDQDQTAQRALNQIARPNMKKGLELFPMPDPFDKPLDEILDELDLDGIHRLIRRMGGI